MAGTWRSMAVAAALTCVAGSASAQVCVGTCGTLGADGVVTAAPTGDGQYQYVVSSGPDGIGIPGLLIGENGSFYRTGLFGGVEGDELAFYFNYVTSDGAGFADFAWARLLNADLSEAALLFSARTTPEGFAVPGFGMPNPDATLDPAPVAIIQGAPVWSPLGEWSGRCYATGCGYTGWVYSTYSLLATGNFYLEFGVANWADDLFDSGLAWAGTTIAGNPIDPPVSAVPEPVTIFLFATGLAGVAVVRRRRRLEAET